MGFFSGIANSISGAASNAVSSVKNAGRSVLAPYRTSVLYDFSTVVKAVIHILEANEMANVGPGGLETKSWTYIKSLPVQINPNFVSRTRGRHWKGIIQGNNDSTAIAQMTDATGYQFLRPNKGEQEENFSVRLDFDIFDEYKARTMDGMIPLDLSLADENVTIIEELYLYSRRQSIYALFMWGDIKFLGSISNVACTYKCFSPYGEPLKAEVELNLRRQPLGKTNDGKEREPDATTLQSAWLGIQGYSGFNKASIMASRVAEESAAIVAPTILRKIKNE